MSEIALPGNGVVVPALDRSTINEIVTFDEAIDATNLAPEQLTVIVNPYTVLNKDKDALLDKPFFIRAVNFAEDEDTGNGYCVLYVVTRDNELYVVTDGSTGIYAQIQDICAKYGRGHSFLIANGLRRSDYFVLDGKAVPAGTKGAQPATTYYLA